MTKAADLVQKGFVTSLLAYFGFQVYQIGRNVNTGVADHPVMHSTYFKDVEEKVKQEYQNADNVVDKRDWYQEDDDSYLKSQVRANITKPEFKQQYEKQSKA